MKRSILYTLFIISVLLIISWGLVASQQPNLEEVINIHIDTKGGNVLTTVKISGDGLKISRELTAYLPKEDAKNVYDYVSVQYISESGERDGNLEVSSDDKYILLHLVDIPQDINEIDIKFFKLEGVVPTEPGKYNVYILSYLRLDKRVTSVDLTLRPPLDVRAVEDEMPIGYSQVQASPPGVTPEQYEVNRFLTETDIKLIEDTRVDILKLEQVSSERVSFILADVYLEMELDAGYQGYLEGNMTLKLINRDKITWPKDTEIYVDSEYEVLKVLTILGAPVDYEFTGKLYKLKLPYPVKPNETFGFNIFFTISDNVSYTGEIFPRLSFNITLKPPTEIPIDQFKVRLGWEKNEIIRDNYNLYGGDLIVISKTVNIDVSKALSESGLSLILISLFIFAVGALIYKNVNRILAEELPEEVRKYLDFFAKEIEVMREAIELEKDHLEGKIKDKDYIKRKASLNKQIKELRRKAREYREELDRMAEDNETLKELLGDIKEVEKLWNELNRLEERRRRRTISLEDYKQSREEVIMRFEIYSSKILRRL